MCEGTTLIRAFFFGCVFMFVIVSPFVLYAAITVNRVYRMLERGDRS